MATRFTFISSAATAGARQGIFPDDEPIDETSKAKIAAAVTSLETPDRVWRSPLLRAQQTADALGLAGVSDPLLRECDYGRWSGRRLADIQNDDPEGLAAWIHDPASSPHGGEAIADLIRRVASFIDAHRRDTGRSVIITHSGVVRAAIIHVIEAPPSCFSRIDIAPLTRTVFSAHDGKWRLACAGSPMA
jgi:broad specificity phosphatase PhoE